MALNRGKTCILLGTTYIALWVHAFFQPWTTYIMAVLALPFVLVALVGLYAAFSVTIGVITFNRSNTALTELKKELKMAEVALKRAGFDFEKFKIPKP